jgi:hypothetical protein
MRRWDVALASSTAHTHAITASWSDLNAGAQNVGVVSFQPGGNDVFILSFYMELENGRLSWVQESLEAIIESVGYQTSQDRCKDEREDNYSKRFQSELVAPADGDRADCPKFVSCREQVLVRPVRSVCLERNWSCRSGGKCTQICDRFLESVGKSSRRSDGRYFIRELRPWLGVHCKLDPDLFVTV